MKEMTMEQTLLILVDHPLTFGFMTLCFMALVGMTYEFILRLFGRRGMVGGDENVSDNSDDKDDDEPPEPALV